MIRVLRNGCEDSSRHKNTKQQNCSSRNTGMPCKNCHDTPGHVLAYMRCMKQSCMASRATSHHFLIGPLQQGQLLSNAIAISRSSLMVTVSYMLLSHITVVYWLSDVRCYSLPSRCSSFGSWPLLQGVVNKPSHLLPNCPINIH